MSNCMSARRSYRMDDDDRSGLIGDESAKLIEPTTKLYKRRWYILLLFSAYSGMNAFQWIQYPIISNIISKFYGVGMETVDWMSLIYMIVYIPLIFPATWMLDRFGLRVIAILGSIFGTIGAAVKILACQPPLFDVAIVGQIFSAIGNVFILGMPSKIAATWFGSKEVSTACSIGVFGNQIGIAFGFFIPPYMVPDSDDVHQVAFYLRHLFTMTTAISAILFVLVCLTFERGPLLPPSRAQAIYLQREVGAAGESYTDSIKYFITSTPALLLLLSYGINTGSFYAISTLLNTEILDAFPNNMKFAGEIGLILVVSGVIGSVVCGLVLDKTGAYKKTTAVVYIATLISLCLYTATLHLRNIAVVYVTSLLLGFTMTGYLPVGFEFAAEITYPISEGTSSGLLNASAQVFGITLTLAMRQLESGISILSANLLLCATLLVGTVLTLLVREDLKRQRANEHRNPGDSPDILITHHEIERKPGFEFRGSSGASSNSSSPSPFRDRR